MKGRRECDVHLESHELLKAFLDHCRSCERGCPMGCIHRHGDVSSLVGTNSQKCASILQCFSRFALSKHDGWGM